MNTNVGSAIVPADPRVRNGEITWRHIEAEYRDVVDEILDTLAPDEPYAYTVPPTPTGDGSIPDQQIMTTRAGIRAAYENMHRFTTVRGMQAIMEIRGDWYVFVYGLGEGFIKSTGQIVHTPTAILFPTMGTSGITGELFWTRSAVGASYTGQKTGLHAAEVAILERHETLLDHFRAGDVAGIVNLTHPGAQTAVRDYVGDSGTLVTLHSAAELATHLEAFFAKFEVLELSLVNRVVSDWFAFAELLWVVKEKTGGNRHLRFYTAEYAEVRADGLIAARIGHGTDPEVV